MAAHAASQFNSTGCIDTQSFAKLSLHEIQTHGKSHQHHHREHSPLLLYRCKKCRSLLATSSNILEVEQGPGKSGFSWKKRSKGSNPSGEESGTYGGGIFVEPLQWMAFSMADDADDSNNNAHECNNSCSTMSSVVQGKLYCPTCKARLGSFNWAGIQSNTGSWVTPGFHLHVSKLDVENALGLVSPLGLKVSSCQGGAQGEDESTINGNHGHDAADDDKSARMQQHGPVIRMPKLVSVATETRPSSSGIV